MPERLIGRTLGKYRVESLLGSGGFAWVFAASDPDLDIVVALKVLKPQYAGDAEFEHRFRREASTAAKLKHPNIIKIYAVGAEHQSVFFAMDLYTQKLSQQIGVMGFLPEPGVLKLGLDISSALGFAHRQGVIHRDIKTDNILFDDHGNAIVADFGIARAAADYAEQTGTNVIMGTPQFFAPEQARGHKIDARADIYSLGVTLYVAATGELPFSGADWYEIATKHVHEAPPNPRSINPMVSPEMERIILKCMEKDRENRYSTADLLYAELESLARRRAGEDNASTILISTPVTGRYLAIRPDKTRQGSWLTSVLVYLLAFVAAAGVFAAVDRTTIERVLAPLVPGVVVQGDSIPPDSVGASGSGRQTGGSGTRGSGRDSIVAGSSGSARFAISVIAPADAAILINGVQVGTGTFQTDTLPAGNYRVSALLPVSAQCIWGRESIVAIIPSNDPKPVTLSPTPCGSMQLSAHRGEEGIPLAADFTVRRDSGEVIHVGRLPLTAPVLLPAGTHKLTITVPLCFPFNGPLTIVKDSTISRAPRLECDDASPPARRR